MPPISESVYIVKLEDIVNEYQNMCHSTIKMKTTNLESKRHIDFCVEIDEIDPKFKSCGLHQNIKI